MYDLSGRAHARANGVALTGLAGVLIAASKHGYIDSARSSLEKLQANNFRPSRALVDTIVELAGESWAGLSVEVETPIVPLPPYFREGAYDEQVRRAYPSTRKCCGSFPETGRCSRSSSARECVYSRTPSSPKLPLAPSVA